MNNSMTSFGMLALACSLALGAALLPNEAAATVYRDTSAGGACKPAYGASTKFLFNNTYLENISTTDQYVVCHFPMDDPNTTGGLATFMNVLFTAGATAGTATCQAQYGYFWGSNFISSSQVANAAASAGDSTAVNFDPTTFARSAVYYTLTMNCKVPGGWRMGLIQYWTDI